MPSVVSLGFFTALIVVGIVASGILMVTLVYNFIREFKKQEIW